MLSAFRLMRSKLLRIVSTPIVAMFIAGVLLVILWREWTGRSNSETEARREHE
jgi:hypothetical protein